MRTAVAPLGEQLCEAGRRARECHALYRSSGCRRAARPITGRHRDRDGPQEPARGRSAGFVFATRRLVRDRIHPGDDRGRLGARGGRSCRGERDLPQIGRKRRQCRGTHLCASGTDFGRTLPAARRNPGRPNIRGDARRPSLAHGRAVAALSFGERVSALPAPPIAIIADDEDLGRLLLAETAVASGLAPLSFDNGVAALKAALSQEVAIVLLDVDMPGMDGYAVSRRLRADPRFATVPIVMVTGHEDSAAISRAFDAGATDFISKPVNWALLPRRLAYILRNAAASERIERLAYFDTLTGLPNRQRCLDTAQRLCADAERSRESVAVLYMDLNSFKRVNDTFGHSVGDAVLQNVADKLSRIVSRFQAEAVHVSVSRFGGDEFVVLVRHPNARSLAADI